MIEELKALKLEPGGLYVIEAQRQLSQRVIEQLREQLSMAGEKFGVKFILLEFDLKLVKEPDNAQTS